MRELDSYREEIVVRAAELLLRQARRFGSAASLAELWPAEARDLAHERGWLTGPAPDPAQLAEARAALAAERAAHPVLARLALRLGLDEPATRLLACCAIGHLDPSILRLWHALRPSPTITGYSLGTWLELLAEDRAALYRALAPEAALRRLRLLDVRPSGPSLLTADAQVPHRVLSALLGFTAEVEDLPPGALAVLPALAAHELVLPAPAPAPAPTPAAAPPPQQPRAAFLGLPSAGRASRARLWASQYTAATVVVDLARVPAEAAAAAIVLGLREAVLRDATPIVRLDALRPEHTARALAELDRFEAPFAVVAPASLSSALVTHVRDVELTELGRMPIADQRRMWAGALAGRGATAELADQIVATYDMLPGNIADVCRRLPRGAAPELTTIRDLVRAGTTTELWGLASRVSTALTWDDVILPPATRDLIRELLAHARHRVAVFDGWGYNRKLNYGRALTALFYGIPGTGKTLVASLLANELGRDLFRVDLSRIVDKYVGETEKNLDRIFAAAGRAHAMLLFDEADSLFAKRTGVDSANDRYANMAVNYLLQALEAFEGLCILTTNMEGSIDEAFRRRMRFRIEFPKPSAAEQAALWRSMITPEARVDPQIPWDRVAEEFPEMTGGHIRSAVLRAAFLAVAEGGIIDHGRIRRAALAEYEELGHIVSSAVQSSGGRRSTL